MGVAEHSIGGLIQKLRSLVAPWRIQVDNPSSLYSSTTELFDMAENGYEYCSGCEVNFGEFCHKYNCRSCGRLLCGACVRCGGAFAIIAASDGFGSGGEGEKVIRSCKFCSKASKNLNIEKIYPSESPTVSPELSPCDFGKICCDDARSTVTRYDDCVSADAYEEQEHELSTDEICGRNLTQAPGHLSQITVHSSPVRRDEEEVGDSGWNFFTPSSEYYHDCSDLDVSSFSAFHGSCDFSSVGSNPSSSHFRISSNQSGDGHPVQQENERSLTGNDVLFNQETLPLSVRHESRSRDVECTDGCVDDLVAFESENRKFQKPLDFDYNGHIWFPPPPEDEDDDTESNYLGYDDYNDDIGESGGKSSAISGDSCLFLSKGKQNEEHKEPLRAVIHGHFRSLVSQLLQGEGIKVNEENKAGSWLDIVSTLAWQAASFVKPDTRKGGSMDPVDYVKVKCIASERPSESILVKGIVCTKNIKHKRMTSQCRNPRLLLLGGSLEYQRALNQLASFNMLFEEEMNHIKAIVSKIEAHRPNVLLVEKSVSPYAQEYLLAKDISLVLNVKKPLLERIAQCTGASITPVDNLHKARIGCCEFFRVEKVSEEFEPANQFHKRPSKTLMFFEGCPRRLGCTVLLKGSCCEELKRVKHVVQYAVFAAYHLSLETSFLADEGATLPKMMPKTGLETAERISTDNVADPAACSSAPFPLQSVVNMSGLIEGSKMESRGLESPAKHLDAATSVLMCMDATGDNVSSDRFQGCSVPGMALESSCLSQQDDSDRLGSLVILDDITDNSHAKLLKAVLPEEQQLRASEKSNDIEASNEYLSAVDNHQSILVSFSSRCVEKGDVCERSRLLRIKFYGSFDKPLGRFLHDDLFDQASICQSCKEPVEAHVLCFTHQQGNLTVNVRRLSSQKLPGERDGRIWMWHRCLRCAYIDGIPPATRRVVMSDAAWGLSFGKFLELSFSNHATANRVASCGHSLRIDCLRFYGFGNMVAFFRYSPIQILSVRLPPSMLEFEDLNKQEWIKKEAAELKSKTEVLYAEIALALHGMEKKNAFSESGSSCSSDLQDQIVELKDLLSKERNNYHNLLCQAIEGTLQSFQGSMDILELNFLRLSLTVGCRDWNHRLYSLDSHLNSRSFNLDASCDAASHPELTQLKNGLDIKDIKPCTDQALIALESPEVQDASSSDLSSHWRGVNCGIHIPTDSQHSPQEKVHVDAGIVDERGASERRPSPVACFSDRINSAWTGMNEHTMRAPVSNRNLLLRSPMAPVRVNSFDSAPRLQERLDRGLLRPMHLSTVKSFHASGDYKSMVRDPVSSTQRAYYQIPPHESQTMSLLLNSHVAEGARLTVPQTSRNKLVIAVYDDEPTSIISYALSSKEHEDWVSNKLSEQEGNNGFNEDFPAPNLSSWPSFGSLDSDYINRGTTHGSEVASSRTGLLFTDAKKSPHLRISFGDETSSAGSKVKFSVTCYFAKQFDMLRRRCCPSEVDFVRSLSRCRKWCAQGGKSNVYFAKSMDERFIIKQVTKTELDSFSEFGPQYFKYLTESLSSRSPTCLAKILGIYQVTGKRLTGGKESKMDLMVMENLFFKRNISKVYDLKGCSRSRYISDPTGKTKVLLDSNLSEALRTNPIFLGSKAKRSLERAVWNDTAFLASVDVMDYSLLVGVDEERKELVLGIIDFMRQYTWDKHLETLVKASGILGGPRNASPTVISPKQYKKRFRKAMTAYFLTVPDQWPS